MRLNGTPMVAIASLLCAAARAGAITANSTFIGGLSGTFQIAFTSDVPGAPLVGVDFNLSTATSNLFLHPTGAAPGYAASLNLTHPFGTNTSTGFLSRSGIANIR